MSTPTMDYTTMVPRQSGIGSSQESLKIDNNYEECFEHFNKNESIGHSSKIKSLIKELNEIRVSCSSDNWDGYGANAISGKTYNEAINIIKMLNSAFLYIPLPEITPEPDGDIGFEWSNDYGGTFVFSIDDNKTVTYAGILGTSKPHGYEKLGNVLPETLTYFISRLY